jgi:ATP adenylyltransferase
MAYIEGHAAETSCIFCDNLAREDGIGNLILHRGRQAFVILNRYPYTNGHMMVVPNVHEPSLDDLDKVTQAELIELMAQTVTVLRRVYGAEAFNIGANIGIAAGAGVIGHVHMHVLPRWSGDTNFMATTAETRVIPESIEETYNRLLLGWRALGNSG